MILDDFINARLSSVEERDCAEEGHPDASLLCRVEEPGNSMDYYHCTTCGLVVYRP